MSNRWKYWYSWLVASLVLLCIILALMSWIGSAYGWDMQNLLAPEGIRWALRSTLSNFAAMPVIPLITVLVAWGVLQRSSWLKAMQKLVLYKWKELSPKQKWGLKLSLVVLFIYLLLLAQTLWGPFPILLSVKGEVANSPFTDGWLILLVFGIILVSGVYGWISGHFRRLEDFVFALSDGITKHAPLFVLLFILSQLIAWIKYIFLI